MEQNIVMKYVESHITDNMDKNGIILDGFPRDMSQVMEFEAKVRILIGYVLRFIDDHFWKYYFEPKRNVSNAKNWRDYSFDENESVLYNIYSKYYGYWKKYINLQRMYQNVIYFTKRQKRVIASMIDKTSTMLNKRSLNKLD